MRRRLLPAFAALSLACSVALAGLSVVSWWQITSAGYVRPAGPWTARVQCMDGAAEFLWWGSTSGVARAGFSAQMNERDATGEGTSLGSRVRTAATGFDWHRGTLDAGRVTMIQLPLAGGRACGPPTRRVGPTAET